MSNNSLSNITTILWPMLAGIIAFLISGILSDLWIMLLNDYIFGSLIAGAIGGFLLGVLLRKRYKIGKMTIAGVVAVPVGFWTSFALGYVISEIPVIANSNVPADFWAVILMGAMVGSLFGAIIYGRKSIWIFAAVGSVLCIGLGSFVVARNQGRFDNLFSSLGIPCPDMLPFILAFGIGIGLSIGLYEMLKQRRTDLASS